MSLSKLSKKQEMNIKIDPNSERIAITCGDAGENHAGMEMLGKLGAQGSGFTTKDLLNIKTFVEELKCKCDYYDLSNDEAVVVNKVKGKYVKTDKRKAAGVLVLRNFLNEETVNKVYKDVTSVEWDTKYYDTRRGVVLNKLARENIVFLKGVEQKADYENKKGTIVDWTKLRNFNRVLEELFELINSVTDGKAGDNVGVLLRGTKREEVERGQVLAKPGSIKPHTKFKAEAYVLKKEEGGRHTPFFTNYRPQFYFRTTDVTGVCSLPEGTEMVMPGDNIAMEVEMIAPIAMDKGVRFAIREGGRTVGSGVVTEIVE